jgi:hypothetical protein
MWDKKNALLEGEKSAAEKPIKVTSRCCGNSPGKSHTHVHDFECANPEEVSRFETNQRTPNKSLRASPARTEHHGQLTISNLKTTPSKPTVKPATK